MLYLLKIPFLIKLKICNFSLILKENVFLIHNKILFMISFNSNSIYIYFLLFNLSKVCLQLISVALLALTHRRFSTSLFRIARYVHKECFILICWILFRNLNTDIHILVNNKFHLYLLINFFVLFNLI